MPILMVSAPVPVPMAIVRVRLPVAPMLMAVAAVVPRLIVVAVVLPRVRMPAALVSSPTPAATVILPVEPTTSKLVKSILAVVPVITFAPTFMALTISVAETSIASVIPFVMPPELVIKITLSTTVEPATSVSALSSLKRVSVLTSTVWEVRVLTIFTKRWAVAAPALLVIFIVQGSKAPVAVQPNVVVYWPVAVWLRERFVSGSVRADHLAGEEEPP